MLILWHLCKYIVFWGSENKKRFVTNWNIEMEIIKLLAWFIAVLMNWYSSYWWQALYKWGTVSVGNWTQVLTEKMFRVCKSAVCPIGCWGLSSALIKYLLKKLNLRFQKSLNKINKFNPRMQVNCHIVLQIGLIFSREAIIC